MTWALFSRDEVESTKRKLCLAAFSLLVREDRLLDLAGF